MLNLVSLQGRLCSDPELRRFSNDIATASFSLAVQRNYKTDTGDYPVDFIRCVCWRSTAENLCKFFKKGDMLIFDGELHTRSYVDSDGKTIYVTEVNVNNFYFVGSTSQHSDSVKDTSKDTSEDTSSDDYPY